MTYKLKSEPEVVYFMETKECTIKDENGVEYEIRISEHTKGTDLFIYHNDDWESITDRELIDWIYNELPYEEVQK